MDISVFERIFNKLYMERYRLVEEQSMILSYDACNPCLSNWYLRVKIERQIRDVDYEIIKWRCYLEGFMEKLFRCQTYIE